MINIKRVIKTTAVWTSIVYVVCYAGVAIYPPIRELFMRYALHADVIFSSAYVNFGYFVSGLIVWNIVAILGVGLFTWLYNKIKE